jgi:ferrochelatase
MPAPLAQSARDQLHRSFGDDPGYIQALANAVSAHWQRHGQADRLVLSFHGIPRRALILGDPYHCECHKTARLLGEALKLPRSG